MSSVKLKIDSNNSIFRSSSLVKPHKTLTTLMSSYSELISQQIVLEQRIIEAIGDWACNNPRLKVYFCDIEELFKERKSKLEDFKVSLKVKSTISQ